MNFRTSLNNSDMSSGDGYWPLLDVSNANDIQKVDEQDLEIPLLGEINFKAQIEGEGVTREEMVEDI